MASTDGSLTSSAEKPTVLTKFSFLYNDVLAALPPCRLDLDIQVSGCVLRDISCACLQ